MKIEKILLFFVITIMMPFAVYAEGCDADAKVDLATKKNYIKYNYEEKEIFYQPGQFTYPPGMTDEEKENFKPSYNSMQINLMNLSKELYIVVSNDINDDEFIIRYEDTNNGVYDFSHLDLSDVMTYTFRVYATSESVCADEEVGIFYLSLPKYNQFYQSAVCEGLEDTKYCQKYTTIKNLTEGQIYSYIENGDDVSTDKDKNNDDKNIILEFLENNYIYIIVGVAIIAVAGCASVVIIRKRSELK